MKWRSVFRSQWRAVLLGGYLAALALFATMRPGPASFEAAVVNIGQFVGPLLAVLLFVPGMFRRGPTGGRVGLCIAGLLIGPVAFAAGQAIWSYSEIVQNISLPFPSWADVGFVTAYLFLFLGVLKMPSRPIGMLARWRILLDSLTSITALVTFSWYFILAPQFERGAESALGKVLSLFYPLADLTLLFCLLMMAGRGLRPGMRNQIVTLAAGLLCIITVDTYFAVTTLSGSYATGGVIDVLWPLGYCLIVYTAANLHRAVSQGAEAATAPVGPAFWQSLLPYAFLPPAVALLCFVYGVGGWDLRSWGVYGGAAVMLFLVLARQCFVICENERLYRRLEDVHEQLEAKHHELEAANQKLLVLAGTDGLTGLSNRRMLQQRLVEESSRAKRSSEPLGVLMLDVDRFKQLNDTFGHPAGDEVLRTIASLIRSCLRLTDLPARFGGEEFVVLLPSANLEQAALVGERVRVAIAEHHFELGTVTVSVGVASGVVEESAELLRAADAALYRSKIGGRNRVTRADEAVAATTA